MGSHSTIFFLSRLFEKFIFQNSLLLYLMDDEIEIFLLMLMIKWSLPFF